MTRKELVKLLESSYAEDDEVYVRYEDDQGDECVDNVKGIGDVTQTCSIGHYEVRNADGDWLEIGCDDVWNYARECVRHVTDSEYDVTRKCIII